MPDQKHKLMFKTQKNSIFTASMKIYEDNQKLHVNPKLLGIGTLKHKRCQFLCR